MRTSSACLLLLSSVLGAAAAPDAQRVLGAPKPPKHDVDPAIIEALEKHTDPVDAYVYLHPEKAKELAEPRLLHIANEKKPQWLTEGDKLRLRCKGRNFVDITDHHEFYAQQVDTMAGHAMANSSVDLPKLTHQSLVKPLFPQVSTEKMHNVLEHMTGFYTRYFRSTTGEQSALWLHNHISEIIRDAPFETHISLDFFTHDFPQPSIIARFEPKVANFSAPLTIIGAHQDSMNYLFPLLPAPGADDDCSGTASILEAFRVLALSGFTPLNGPVEFHWYAAEEGGLLGSQAIAKYKKESGASIGAMLEFDMTAFVAKNTTESISLIETDADADLTKWLASLIKEYSSIPVGVHKLSPCGTNSCSGAGSDYMSYTKAGYPAAFATEGDPTVGGFPGDFDPYVHTSRDTMDVDDEKGRFSLD
ncbi:hypothetical protein Golomagni_06956, partial [Golovinomyces magnicellulatus]